MADTIKEMQKSPQGKTTTGTDENGLDGKGKATES